MNIPRFFIEPKYINLPQKLVSWQDAKLCKQLRKVLRLGNGDKIDILDGLGNIYHCSLVVNFDIGQDVFIAKIEGHENLPIQSKTNITIGLPLIKANRFEWALEKLTELGVDTIVPIALHRSVIKIPDQHRPEDSSETKAKFIRWQKIIQEAAEQCERVTPPALVPPLSFVDWLTQTSSSLKLICVERQSAELLETMLYNQKNRPISCAIALGAEGGFTEEEIKLAFSHQFLPVSLGTLILRSETAAVYTLAVINAVLRLNKRDTTK